MLLIENMENNLLEWFLTWLFVIVVVILCYYSAKKDG